MVARAAPHRAVLPVEQDRVDRPRREALKLEGVAHARQRGAHRVRRGRRDEHAAGPRFVRAE